MSELEQDVLAILSFYEEMNLSKIVIDIDDAFIKKYPEFSNVELLKILDVLEKKKLIKKTIRSKEKYWIRTFKKQSLWRRLKSYIGM